MAAAVDFRGIRAAPGPNDVSLFRFLIPFRAASVIYGNVGERLQRLMLECNTRMSISNSNGPERVFTIEGSLDSCIRVWTDLFPDLTEVMGAASRRLGNEMDLRMLCHQSIVGAVIGRGGARVKEMRATHQLALIKVHQDVAPASTDRVIQVVGQPDKIFDCFRVMFAELSVQGIRGPINNYRSDNFKEEASPMYGGWTMEGVKAHRGLGAAVSAAAAAAVAAGALSVTAALLRAVPPPPPPPPAPVAPSNPGQWWTVVALPPGASGNQTDIQAPPASQEGPQAPKRTRLFQEDPPAVVVSVPASCLAAVNGDRLGTIMRDSGARIAVAPLEGGREERLFSLSGSRDQIEGAQFLMQMSIKRHMLNI